MNHLLSDHDLILAEIFLTPSVEAKVHELNASGAEMSGCNGQCGSGVCRTLV